MKKYKPTPLVLVSSAFDRACPGSEPSRWWRAGMQTGITYISKIPEREWVTAKESHDIYS